MNSDYYPAGAYSDPNAPWNQPGNPDPMEITVRVTTLLSHETTVETDNYNISIVQDEEWKGKEIVLHDNATDVEKYYKAQHKSVPELLGELAKYIKGELASDISQERKNELNAMLADCDGWKTEDIQVEDYDY